MTFGDNPDNPFRNFRFPPRDPNNAAPRRIGALPITIIVLTILAVVLVSLSGFMPTSSGSAPWITAVCGPHFSPLA
jgi:hypothetical protein